MNTSGTTILELSLKEVELDIKQGLCIWDSALSEMQFCRYAWHHRVFGMDTPVRFKDLLKVIRYYHRMDRRCKNVDDTEKVVFLLEGIKTERLFLWARYITQVEVDFVFNRIRIHYQPVTTK